MAFLNDLGLTWKERAALLLMKNKDPRKGPPFLSHLTFSDYTRYGYMTEEEMGSFHVFSVVRNPYKRVESFYRFLGYDCAISFDYFVTRVLPTQLNSDHPCHYFCRPQVDFLKDADGNIAVNHCLKLEDVEKLILHLNSLGIDEFPHVNKSIKRGRIRQGLVRLRYWIRGVYDPRFVYGKKIKWTRALAAKINRLYAEDFLAFNYDLFPENFSKGHHLGSQAKPEIHSNKAISSGEDKSVSPDS